MTNTNKQILENDMLKHVPSLNDIDIAVAQVGSDYYMLKLKRGEPDGSPREITRDEAEYLCDAVADGAGFSELNTLHGRYAEVFDDGQPWNAQ